MQQSPAVIELQVDKVGQLFDTLDPATRNGLRGFIRGEAASIWVVPSTAITSSDPSDAGELFEPALSKDFRHPTYYEVPDGVANL